MKKMKIKEILQLTFFLIIAPFITFSQNNSVGNEWINYDQPYLKITTEVKGLFRISKKEILDAGFILDKKNPKNLQVYFRGKELAINVKGESDNVFDDNDYVEFFAINNDGAQDEEVYKPRSARPHPYYSLYSNETSYFLTFSANKLGKRMINPRSIPENLEIEPYYFSKILKVFSEQWNFDVGGGYSASDLANSFFDPNESLVSKAYRLDKTGDDKDFEETVTLDNIELAASINDQPKYEVMVFSRKNSSKTIRWKANTQEGVINLSGFNYYKLNQNLGQLGTDKLNIKVEIENSNDSSIPQNDRFSLGYYIINYPKKFIFSDNSEYFLKKNISNQSKIKFSNSSKLLLGIDITDFYNQRNIISEVKNNESTLFVDSTQINRTLWISEDVISPKSIELIKFNKPSNLNYDYLIITDKTLLESAQLYSNYRNSVQGGGYAPLILETKNLYNEYTFGEKTPYALIKAINNLRKTFDFKFLFLIGKGFSYTPNLKLKEREAIDLVPTVGYPASDLLLTLGINEKNETIPTGRIATTTNVEVINYLNKVIEFEAENKLAKNISWKKNFLHLSGGADLQQINQFKDLLNDLGTIVAKSKIGGKFSTISKTTASQTVEKIDISNYVNNGVSFITFCGHSSASALDLNIGYASDETLKYKNKPNYPFLFFNGCSAANVFTNSKPLTTDWISTAEKGAIGVLAQSYYSFASTNSVYMTRFYDRLFSSTELLNKPIGTAIKIIDDEILNQKNNDPFLLSNVQLLILQGDPAIRIFNMAKPDFQTGDEQLFLTSIHKNKAIADNDSISLGMVFSNLGIYEAGTNLNLNLKKTYLDGKTSNQPITIKTIAYRDTVYVSLKKELDLKNISITLDYDSKVDEIDEANNNSSITFNWETLKNTSYYSLASLVDIVNPNLEVKIGGRLPENGMEVASKSFIDVKLIDENSLGTKTDKLEISYRQICDKCPEGLKKVHLGELTGSANEIITQIDLNGFLPGEYEIFIQGYDAKKNPSGEVLSFKFIISESQVSTSVNVFPNPMLLYTNFEFNLNKVINASFTIDIYNQIGLNVKTIYGYLNSGINNIYWDRSDNSGNSLSVGQYIYNVLVNYEGKTETKKGKIRIND